MIYSNTYLMLFKDFDEAQMFALVEGGKGNFGLIDASSIDTSKLTIEKQLDLDLDKNGNPQEYKMVTKKPPILTVDYFQECAGLNGAHIPDGFIELCEQFTKDASKLDWGHEYEKAD
jgi:hypothetical protein